MAIVATKNFFFSFHPFLFFSSFFDSGGFISGFLIVIQHHTHTMTGKKSTLSMLLENSQQLDDNENVLYSMSDEDEDYQHHFHQDSDEDELPKSFNSAHFSVSEDRFMKDHDLKVKAFEALHNSGSNNNNHNQVQTFSPVSPKLTSVKRRSSIIDMPQRLNNFNPAIPQNKFGQNFATDPNALPDEYPSDELIEFYQNVKKCLDFRQKYLDLSLQTPELLNPKTNQIGISIHHLQNLHINPRIDSTNYLENPTMMKKRNLTLASVKFHILAIVLIILPLMTKMYTKCMTKRQIKNWSRFPIYMTTTRT